MQRRGVIAACAAAVAAGALLGACARAAPGVLPPTSAPRAPASAPTSPTPTTSRPPAATAPSTSVPPPTSSTTTTTSPTPSLGVGASGPAVLALQQRLSALGYWLGTPTGTFNDATEQAVFALQKAAGISRDGLVGPVTQAALARGVVPHPAPAQGYLIEVDLADDLLMFVTGGKLEWTLNTSTGGGYVYTGDLVAVTPTGLFTISREIDGMVTDNLGQLWRPKYVVGGVAIHGDSWVPPYPVSHGCIRVSNEAIDWIWTHAMAPIGTKVLVYG